MCEILRTKRGSNPGSAAAPRKLPGEPCILHGARSIKFNSVEVLSQLTVLFIRASLKSKTRANCYNLFVSAGVIKPYFSLRPFFFKCDVIFPEQRYRYLRYKFLTKLCQKDILAGFRVTNLGTHCTTFRINRMYSKKLLK